MAKNFIQPGSVITVAAPAAVASGDPVQVGENAFGVATHSAASGAPLELATEGVYELPKVTANVVAQGDRLYFDGTNLTTTATSNLPVGYATEAADGTVSLVKVRLTPNAMTP